MAKPKVVLMSDHAAGQIDELLKLAPPDMDVSFVDMRLSDEEKIAKCKDVFAFILLPAALPVAVAKACPKLRLIQTMAAGYDRLDLKGLNELGIPVANNGGSNGPPVAEHTLGLMLMVYRQMAQQWYVASKEKKWRGNAEPITMHEVQGKTVGIVGLGRIGKRVARLLKGFGCTILFHDIVEMPPEIVKELGVTKVPFDELLKRSDIVTLHVPLTRLTRKMMGAREFGLMKPSGIVINACRGPVVDERALYEALKSKKIAGAGIDVLEKEPTPADNPLFTLENVVITPHMAGSSYETTVRGANHCYENIRRVMEGKKPEAIVTPEE